MEGMLKAITHVRHGGVRFEADDSVVYVDRYHLCNAAPHDADIIMITHAHGDHYSPGDIDKIMQDSTTFYVSGEVAQKLQEKFLLPKERVCVLAAHESARHKSGVCIDAVVAENKNHPTGTGFGVVLALCGFVYYLSGDTDVLDENVQCDVLFCVCDAKYNMPNYLQSAPMEIMRMKVHPKLVVPYHFDNADREGNGQRLADELNRIGIASQVFPFT